MGESFGFVIAGNCSFAMFYCSCPAVCSTNCHGIIVYGFDFEMNKKHLEFLIVMSVTWWVKTDFANNINVFMYNIWWPQGMKKMCAISFKNQIFVPNMLIKPLNLAVSIDYVNSICMFCFTFSLFSFFFCWLSNVV